MQAEQTFRSKREEIIAKFSAEAEALYCKEPIFAAVIEMLVRDIDPYAIIESLINLKFLGKDNAFNLVESRNKKQEGSYSEIFLTEKEIIPHASNYVLKYGHPVQTDNGAYYHYSNVVSMLNGFVDQQNPAQPAGGIDVNNLPVKKEGCFAEYIGFLVDEKKKWVNIK